MPKIMYTPKGEKATADDEQVDILLKAGWSFKLPKKKEVNSSSDKEEESKDTDSKRKLKSSRRKKL